MGMWCCCVAAVVVTAEEEEAASVVVDGVWMLMTAPVGDWSRRVPGAACKSNQIIFRVGLYKYIVGLVKYRSRACFTKHGLLLSFSCSNPGKNYSLYRIL